jgi:hypothetical protein
MVSLYLLAIPENTLAMQTGGLRHFQIILKLGYNLKWQVIYWVFCLEMPYPLGQFGLISFSKTR